MRLQLISSLQILLYINIKIKSAIIKAGISGHFPILFVAKVNVDIKSKNRATHFET